MSLNVQVRLTSSLGPSALSYVNEFIFLLGLSLSGAITKSMMCAIVCMVVIIN